MQPPGAVVRLGTVKRALVVVLCGALTVTLAACESTEQESQKIAREGKQLTAEPAALKLHGLNRSVRVSDVTILNSAGRTAVAARLTSTSTQAQTHVPVLLTVSGKGGKVLYSNDTGGLEASLQSIPLLRPGQSAWWVDDQVLTSQTASAATVRVGPGGPSRSSATASIATTAVHSSQQAGITVLSGELVNHSSKALGKVPVFAVAVRGSHVLAAGRAIVGALPGHAGATAPFQVFLVGSASGARTELTAVPTDG